MSNEYFPGSAEYPQEPNEHQTRLYIIDGIRIEAINIIEGLRSANHPRTGGVEESFEWILSTTRIAWLEDLSKSTLEMAENGSSDTPIETNDQSFSYGALATAVDDVPEDIFALHGGDFTESIRLGMAIGTSDFLELITPDDIISEYGRHLHFFPWRRDLLELTDHETHQAEDGIVEVRHRTKLPNIEVVDSYPATGKPKPPHRSIRLIKGPGRPTPPSLLQQQIAHLLTDFQP